MSQNHDSSATGDFAHNAGLMATLARARRADGIGGHCLAGVVLPTACRLQFRSHQAIGDHGGYADRATLVRRSGFAHLRGPVDLEVGADC